MENREDGLLQALTELADFLDRYGETRWAMHFRWCRNDLDTLIQKSAPSSEKAIVASRVRSMYGGMGSFRDLVIHPLNEHPVDESQVDGVNEMLNKLAEKVYSLSFTYQER